MNKKKLIAEILINIVWVIVLIGAIYMLAFEELNQWQRNLSMVLVVIAMPLIFIPILARTAFKKYDNLIESEEELWEEQQEKD